MPAVTVSTDLSAPIDKVWAVVGNMSAQPEWSVTHVEFPNGLPELADGVEFTQKVKNMGMPNDIQWTVTALEGERVLELTGKAPMNISVRQRFELAAVDGGTRLTIENEIDGTMIKMMAGRVKTSVKADLDASIAKLKTIVE